MTKATRTTTTRRQLVKLGAAAASSIVVPAATTASPALAAQPSRWGRKLLQLIALYQHLWASPPNEAADREGYERFEHRTTGVLDEIRDLAAGIADRPVRSLADVIDRVIIAIHYRDEPEDMMPALGGILAVADVRPRECCTGDPDETEELASARGLDL